MDSKCETLRKLNTFFNKWIMERLGWHIEFTALAHHGCGDGERKKSVIMASLIVTTSFKEMYKNDGQFSFAPV